MTIWPSYDDAQTWTRKRIVSFGYVGLFGHGCCRARHGAAGVQSGPSRGVTFAGSANDGFPRFLTETALARVNLRWLESEDPYQFTYYFNEGTPGGQLANAAGASDAGLWTVGPAGQGLCF